MGGLLQQVRDQPPQLLVLIGIQVNKFNANSKRCDIPHGRLRPDGICPGQNFNLQRFAHGGQILRFKERPADGQVPHQGRATTLANDGGRKRIVQTNAE